MPVESTPRRRRLGAEFRRLREERGWTQDEAARRLGYRSLSTISKIESGVQGLKIQQLSHFFEIFGITDPTVRDEIRTLARHAGEADWWQRYEGVVDDPLGDYLTEVESATSLFVFNPVVIHGLMQTPDYARAVVEPCRVWKTDDEIDRFVALRLEHQTRLLEREQPLKMWAVLTEGQLRREVGGREAMRRQVEHLGDLARSHPHITIQVLPFSSGAHAGMDGPFMYMTFATGRDTVCLESMRASMHVHHPDTVELYRTTSDLLKSEALPRRDSLALLETIARDLS